MREPRLTITLSGVPSVSIERHDWPILAQARDAFDPSFAHELFVRRHGSGRAIVYGVQRRGALPQRRGGAVLPAGADLPAAIKAVGAQLAFDAELVERCIANLPAIPL